MKTKTWNMLFIALLTIAALAWAAFLLIGTMSYQPAYRQPQGTGQPLPPLVPRVVLVIVDGLRYDVAEKMPSLHTLQQAGASARSISAVPSMSQPTWTTLLTGARPEINGAVLFNAPLAQIKPIQVEHIFQLAKQTGLSTALAGQEWWEKMVPRQYLDKAHFVQDFDAKGDLEATQAAIEFLQDSDLDFLLLYLGQFDDAADRFGAFSPQAQQAVQNVNDNLSALLSHVNLNNTVLVITADHGQMARGGHGGDDKPVLETPCIMAGPRVRSGAYPAIQQPDIPTTIAALLGTPLPRSSQGRILYEFLDVSAAEKARGQSALAEQRVAQADAYLWSIKAQALPGTVHTHLSTLDALLRQEKIEDAGRLANSILNEVDHAAGRARAARINQSRLARLPIALLGLVLIVTTFALNWRNGQKLALLLSLIGVAAVHTFWLLRGQVYSLSTFGIAAGPTYIALSLVGGVLLAMALGLVVLGILALARKASFSRQAVAAYCTGLVSWLFLLALLANLGNGGLGRWNLVVPVLAFLLLLSLIQAALAGLFSLIIMGLAALVDRVRGRLLSKR